MDIKRERCVAAFERLGMVNADSLFGEYSQKGPFLKLEEGVMTPSEFREEVRKLIARKVTDKEIDTAFCEFLISIPRHRLEALRQLRKSYNVYLLSNTNSIMWESRIAEEFRQEGLEVKDYFDGIVTSFEVKSIKPDRRIFEITIERCGILPEETIFLDDSQKNLDTAAQLGFGTILVSPGAEFMDLLK